MTDDLIARLRNYTGDYTGDYVAGLRLEEAADALEARGKRIDELESRLIDKEAQIAELEAVLKPFAKHAVWVADHRNDDEAWELKVRVRDLRAARAVLGEKE